MSQRAVLVTMCYARKKNRHTKSMQPFMIRWQYATFFSNSSRNLLIDTVDVESDLK